MPQETLKPFKCPFCGGKPDLINDYYGYRYYCNWARCKFNPEANESSDTEIKALEVWNRRVK